MTSRTRSTFDSSSDELTGELDRPASLGLIAVPRRIDLDQAGRRIVWSNPRSEDAKTALQRIRRKPRPRLEPPELERLRLTLGYPKLVTPGKRMLEEFLELPDAEAPRILDYARKWGVLAI